MIRRGIGVQSFVSAGVSTDADAQAFITAAGITDATQQSAINTLVTDLKGYGIWSKMKAIYPFVGGTSSTHKWNLKDPRDLNAAFRLVFAGGMTHSSNGVLFGGVNGYADSNLIPRNELSNNNAHFSTYCRSNNSGTQGDLGRYINGTNEAYIQIRYSDGKLYASIQQEGATTDVVVTNSNSQGNYIINRTASNLLKVYKNSSIFGTNTNTNSGLLPDQSIYLGQLGVAGTFSNREYSFCTIGDGLTDTEAGNLYTAVQAYQTTLSRNV